MANNKTGISKEDYLMGNKTFRVTNKIIDGRLHWAALDKTALDLFYKENEGNVMTVTIEPGYQDKTTAQINYYKGIARMRIAEYTGYTPLEVDAVFKAKYMTTYKETFDMFDEKKAVRIPVVESFGPGMKINRMSELIGFINDEGENMGIPLRAEYEQWMKDNGFKQDENGRWVRIKIKGEDDGKNHKEKG